MIKGKIIVGEQEDDETNIMFAPEQQAHDHTININEITTPAILSSKHEYRTVKVPNHRYTPLRNSWEKIVTTVIENLHLDIRMNTKRKMVELRTNDDTKDMLDVQRAADFLKSFMLGFDLTDSIAMLRLDDLYLETFEVKDGKLSPLT